MVDILLATYNGQAYLPEMLESLSGQTVQDFHLYVRDDGSNDDTPAILEQFRQNHPQKVTVIADNLSIGNARDNFFELLNYSSAEYIMFADQDDVWDADKIELSLKEIMREESGLPILLHTDLCVVDETLHMLSPSLMQLQRLNQQYRTLNRLIAQNNVTGCTMMMNRALVGLFRNADGILMHDWWLALIAAAFGKICYLNRATVKYRQHTANEVGAKDVKSASYFRQKLSNTGGIRESIEKTYLQAQAFLNAYDDLLTAEQKELLTVFTGLHSCGKWKRMRLLHKYGLYKSGIYRKIGQIIYG